MFISFYVHTYNYTFLCALLINLQYYYYFVGKFVDRKTRPATDNTPEMRRRQIDRQIDSQIDRYIDRQLWLEIDYKR